VRAQGLGIKGGYAYDNVTNNGALPGGAKARTGFAAGIGLNTGGLVGLGAEALYAQRGTTSSAATAARQLNYVDIPVYLNVALSNPAITPFAYAGPQWSRELSCKSEGADCPETGRPKTTTSAVIGAGVRLGHHGLSAEGRYVYGLTDLKLNTVSSSDSYKSRTFLILVGLGF
jgi:hypothetical protein